MLKPPNSSVSPTTLSPSVCHPVGTIASSSDTATLTWKCVVPTPKAAGFTVAVVYHLAAETTFLSKELRIRSNCSAFWLTRVAPWQSVRLAPGTVAAGAADVSVATNDFDKAHPIAAFTRWDQLRRGTFVAIANPFATYNATPMGTTLALTAEYAPRMAHTPESPSSSHMAEPAVLGLTSLTRFYRLGAARRGPTTRINSGEQRAFVACIRAMLLDAPMRANTSVKTAVGWDSSDYQLDIARPSGAIEYERLIERSAEFGITHVVFAPRDTKRGSRRSTSDDWGWEMCLWFGMGEQLREGRWDPRNGTIPPEVAQMVRFAATRGVGLLAYVYPALAFEAASYAFGHGRQGGNRLDLSNPRAARWLTETLLAFMRVSGAAGFAFDHGSSLSEGGRHPAANEYAQWRAWVGIVAELRAAYPDIIIDHRETDHMRAPWTTLGGSYAPPLAGDENPESYVRRL